MTGYRFKITSKDSGRILMTGMFTTRHEINHDEQIAFLHEYTHGEFINREEYINIEINKTK